MFFKHTTSLNAQSLGSVALRRRRTRTIHFAGIIVTTLTLQPQRAHSTPSHRPAPSHSEFGEASKELANGIAFEGIKQAKILVVDEDSSSVAVQRILAAEGYTNVVAARDAAHVKGIGIEVRPDLIMLDALLWGADGLEF